MLSYLLLIAGSVAGQLCNEAPITLALGSGKDEAHFLCGYFDSVTDIAYLGGSYQAGMEVKAMVVAF